MERQWVRKALSVSNFMSFETALFTEPIFRFLIPMLYSRKFKFLAVI